MLNSAQSALSKVLPEPVFERLYRIAVRLDEATVRLEDWAYYHRIVTDPDEKLMRETIKKVLPYTMVGRGGLIATYQAVMDIERRGVEGCFVECGVARGGSAALMMLASRCAHTSVLTHREWDKNQRHLDSFRNSFWGNRAMFLFDSFEGLPAPTKEDGCLRNPRDKSRSSNDLTEGHCLGTREEVERILFEELGLPPHQVRLVKGWFQDTLPVARKRLGKTIAVLRIDGDWYESTKCCLENLYDCVVDSGYVILDDYALVGCRKAVDEFFTGRGKQPKITLDGRGGGWFIKE